eukprot:TRINITY_DN4915_c0_g3_i2.p1 TRINITY_DN4915_c0_g3~~TRINITY_DN4915_c0_g3_i2.p1  ORF type:complete len:116 (-),score=15.69 TRINITY_DN4915_c0_g3_i2:131-478(-)
MCALYPEGGRRSERTVGQVDFRCKVVGVFEQANPLVQPRTDAEGASEPRKGSVIRLPRKASRGSSHCDRTSNGHTQARREAQGARVNCGEGTRQIDPVTSGEGVPAVGDHLRGVS